MKKNQRIALIAMLLVLAATLHVLCFEWTYGAGDSYFVYSSFIFGSLGCDLPNDECLRIMYNMQLYPSSLILTLLGIVIPIILSGTALYLHLGGEGKIEKTYS